MTLRDTRTGGLSRFRTGGVFVAIGHLPNTTIFRGKLEMNEVRYLNLQHPSTRTSVEGVFAAGDVADHPTYREAVSAAGAGLQSRDGRRALARVQRNPRLSSE